MHNAFTCWRQRNCSEPEYCLPALQRSGLSATALKDTSYPAPTNRAMTKKHNSKALSVNIFNCLTVSLQKHMFLYFCEELGMEVGKMPVLVPPSLLAELQSLCAEESDQTSKKTHGKCDSSCQVKIYSFISAFLLSILSVFSTTIVPHVVGIIKKNFSNMGYLCCPPHQVSSPSTSAAPAFQRCCGTAVFSIALWPLVPAKFFSFQSTFPSSSFQRCHTGQHKPLTLSSAFLRVVGLATGTHSHRQL